MVRLGIRQQPWYCWEKLLMFSFSSLRWSFLAVVPLEFVLNFLEMVSEAERVSSSISLYPTPGWAEVTKKALESRQVRAWVILLKHEYKHVLILLKTFCWSHVIFRIKSKFFGLAFKASRSLH